MELYGVLLFFGRTNQLFPLQQASNKKSCQHVVQVNSASTGLNLLTPRSDQHETSPYIIQQTADENIQTYQVEVVVLIWHQILMTNLQGYV